MAKSEIAIFAAGCFWGVQDYFDKVPGVVKTTVGYTGGDVKNPTYEQVCSQKTGHAEATKVEFDPDVVDYAELLRHFFRMHDPTQMNRQGPDVGSSYRSAVFYVDDGQRRVAEDFIAGLEREHVFDKPIVTEVTGAGEFWPAEEYHQKFVEKNGYGACHVLPDVVK